MKLEDQVVSLELAKKLKELGVKQESVFKWMEYQNKKTSETVWELSGAGGWNHTQAGDGRLSGRSWKNDWDGACSAFTVAELGEMLPAGIRVPYKNGRLRKQEQHIHMFRGTDCWIINYTGGGSIERLDQRANAEADARANMLIYLIENKLIKAE